MIYSLLQKKIILLISPKMINKCQLVKKTCLKVTENAKHVQLVPEKIVQLANKFHYTQFNDFDCHNIVETNEELTLRYLLTLDSLNFCFWPLQNFEYEDLANNVKKYIESNAGHDGLEKLLDIDEQILMKEIFNGIEVPLADERARILREMSNVVTHQFKGSVSFLIKSAQKSAVRLLNILTQNFPNFQDHSIYNGKQVHFYKRSQILIGDIWAKFQGKGIGEFLDIDQLTMFPDYRVPQILNQYQILKYSQQLNDKILAKQEIQSGSQQQIQIRAFSVVAVEKIKQEIQKLKGKKVHSIEADWFLWEEGEKNLNTIRPHHRTLTIYY